MCGQPQLIAYFIVLYCVVCILLRWNLLYFISLMHNYPVAQAQVITLMHHTQFTEIVQCLAFVHFAFCIYRLRNAEEWVI